MNQRHVEFFGPDFARGPFAPHRIETAAIQIATGIAQLRAPLTRSDTDILAHGDFIRQLADRIAPDYAAAISFDVGDEDANTIEVTIQTALQSHSLLDCWLADEVGGGPTSVAPTAVVFDVGEVLKVETTGKHYRVITSSSGIIRVRVTYSGTQTWYWAVSRFGRVHHSSALSFV